MIMFRFKCALGAYLLASTLIPTVVAHTATYYVATTGLDTHNGSEAMPWKTIKKAAATMIAGDTTLVKAGTYNEGPIHFRKSGTSTKPIKLLGYPGTMPKIHFINGLLEGGLDRFTIWSTAGTHSPIGWLTIEGLEIENGHEGIKVYTGHDITIQRNWIHDNGHGILGNGTRLRFDRNIISHNGQFDRCAQGITAACSGDHGIYFHGSKIIVTNNLFYDNLSYGIQLNGTASYDPGKHPGPDFALSHDWIIANNTFAYQNYGSGIVVWGATCLNARIENNIFYENRVNSHASQPQGIEFSLMMTCTGITIRNNLAYATGSGGMKFLGSGANEWVHYRQSGNLVNTHNPKFVNAPAILQDSPNFALTERSPAIDAGLPLAVTKISFDGTPRPQGRAYDIGAYEYIR